MLPLISCIMPTFNRREFIPCAIQYFLRQDYLNRELIIVDDGTDPIGDLIPPDPRLRYIRLTTRHSIGAKRNIACEAAQGDVIAHWDDDDWHAPTRLSVQLAALQRAGTAICGMRRMLFDHPTANQTWLYTYTDQQRPWAIGGSLLYTRDFWCNNRFPNQQVGEDTGFLWAKQGVPITIVDDLSLYIAFIHSGNTSPKITQGAYWSRWQGDLTEIMGSDLALYRSNHQASVSAQLSERPTMQMTTIAKVDDATTLLPGVSVVIPHKGKVRLSLLAATLANLSQYPEVGEIIVVELGEFPCAEAVARQWTDKYLFAKHTGPFERARALNLAIPFATYELLMWLDNDIIVPPGFIAKAIRELRTRQLDSLIPYKSVRYLSVADSELVRRGMRDPLICVPANALHSSSGMSGASVLVRHDFVRQYGGMCEDFRGWGAEDDAWVWKTRILGRAAVTQYDDQHLYHLFHPLSGGYGSTAQYTGNPHYRDNQRLLQEMRAIRDRNQFLNRFPAPKFFTCPWTPDQRIIFFSKESDDESEHLANEIILTLNNWYGIQIEHEILNRDNTTQSQPFDAAVIFGMKAAQQFLANKNLIVLLPKTLALIAGVDSVSQDEIQQWSQFGAILTTNETVAATFNEIGGKASVSNLSTDVSHLTRSLIQRSSLFTAEVNISQADHSAPQQTLPVWIYWEGTCPAWIKECQRTIFLHGGDVHLLTPESFDALWDSDRDIDLKRLHVAHRADYIRAFLLSRYGGLWIDSDCLVMQSLQPIFDLLNKYDFVCHRERQGIFSNGFLGASSGSRVAADYYRRICELLRSGQKLAWTTLGSEALTEIISNTDANWYELEYELIQPVCWSNPDAFFAIGDESQHERNFNKQSFCYMLANQAIQRLTASRKMPDLLNETTFFSFLLKRALNNVTTTVTNNHPNALQSNAWKQIPFGVEAIIKVAPQHVLELGAGLGRWGLLMREFCEESDSENWRMCIECVVQSAESTMAQLHTLYNKVHLSNEAKSLLCADQPWDLVIFSDVMHQWSHQQIREILSDAVDHSAYVLVNVPLRTNDWRLNDFLGLPLVDYSISDAHQPHEYGAFLLSRDDPKRLSSQPHLQKVFAENARLYQVGGEESLSGPGSTLVQTAEIRRRLPLLIADLHVKTLLDLPCGDFNWLQHVRLGVEQYIGGDVLPQLVEKNQARYGNAQRRFIQLNLIHQPLPQVDMILCRDCLVHFSFDQIFSALRNFKYSGSKYLLLTTFPKHTVNTDIETGDWRTLNFECPPFNFRPPIRLITEKCTEANGQYVDKSLGLWRLSDLT